MSRTDKWREGRDNVFLGGYDFCTVRSDEMIAVTVRFVFIIACAKVMMCHPYVNICAQNFIADGIDILISNFIYLSPVVPVI